MTEFLDTCEVTCTVNGVEVSRSLPPRLTLAELLRDILGLTGTKLSCHLQVCGVCTVLVDGRPVSSCTYLAVDADGQSIQTVEGLSGPDGLHPLQECFVDCLALQCGFCTPGFLMMAKALLDQEPNPSDDDILDHLDGNLCRCTGYRPIAEAVRSAAQRLRGETA